MKSGKFNIIPVTQDRECGCTIACIAMIRGVKQLAVDNHFAVDFNTVGINTGQILNYLSDYGYTLVFKSLECWNHPRDGFNEITKPFADVHIVTVQDYSESNYHHAVVMLKDGKIINPMPNGRTDLKAFYQVHSSIGIWK